VAHRQRGAGPDPLHLSDHNPGPRCHRARPSGRHGYQAAGPALMPTLCVGPKVRGPALPRRRRPTSSTQRRSPA
jgi:hypothetical protein